jgi:hypothetical protein
VVAGVRLPLVALTVIVTVPAAVPYTLTALDGCVWPGATVTVEGDTVALVGSLLEISRYSVDAGAFATTMESGVDSPGATEAVAGTRMSTILTVTLAVASVTLGKLGALA